MFSLIKVYASFFLKYNIFYFYKKIKIMQKHHKNTSYLFIVDAKTP